MGDLPFFRAHPARGVYPSPPPRLTTVSQKEIRYIWDSSSLSSISCPATTVPYGSLLVCSCVFTLLLSIQEDSLSMSNKQEKTSAELLLTSPRKPYGNILERSLKSPRKVDSNFFICFSRNESRWISVPDVACSQFRGYCSHAGP